MERAIKKLLDQAIADCGCVTVLRTEPEAPLALIPVAYGKQLLLGHCLGELQLDGYRVIDLETAQQITRGEADAFVDKILRGEGLLDGLRPPEPCETGGWAALFAALLAESRMVELELEYSEEMESFYVGRVASVEDDHVLLRTVDPVGNWDPEPAAVYYDEILSVGYGGRYPELYAKYSGLDRG